MSNFLDGSLFRVEETVQVNEKFSKRSFVLVTLEDYPQHIEFQLTQDRCDLIDSFKKNDHIRVHYDLRGKLVESGNYEGRVFNNINAWKIDNQNEGQSNGLGEPKKAEPMGDNGEQLPF